MTAVNPISSKRPSGLLRKLHAPVSVSVQVTVSAENDVRADSESARMIASTTVNATAPIGNIQIRKPVSQRCPAIFVHSARKRLTMWRFLAYNREEIFLKRLALAGDLVHVDISLHQVPHNGRNIVARRLHAQPRRIRRDRPVLAQDRRGGVQWAGFDAQRRSRFEQLAHRTFAHDRATLDDRHTVADLLDLAQQVAG